MGTPVTHGALDHAELRARGLRPDAVRDWSSNLNPYGPPAGVRAALAALDPAPYPDRSCVQLRQALAEQHGCEVEQVLCGNGSNELIHLLARALLRSGDGALVVAPTFGEYAHACLLAGARITEWRATLDGDFSIDVADVVRQIERERPRLVWLCAPNNPTGVDISPDELATLAQACATVGGWLVLDRTYSAFVRGRESHVDQFRLAPPNIIYLHSLTKSYALAGLRLGYLVGNADVLARIGAFQPTWSVSSAAQVAGLAALRDTEFLARTLPLLWHASDALRDALCELGFAVWRGALPFLLVRTGDSVATRAALLEQGLLVRDCDSFGLPEWVRVAPRRHEENAALVEALRHLSTMNKR